MRQIPKSSGNWYAVVTHRGERRAQKMSSEAAAEKKAGWVRKRLDKTSDQQGLHPAEEYFGVLYPLFLVALRTAARQGEIVALAWDSIDWNGSFITIKHTAVNG